jgi:hypothetical protein
VWFNTDLLQILTAFHDFVLAIGSFGCLLEKKHSVTEFFLLAIGNGERLMEEWGFSGNCLLARVEDWGRIRMTLRKQFTFCV